MKTIIALRGKGNSGKSEAIRILHELLLHNGYLEVEGNFRQSRKDYHTIFSKNGMLIGVTSLGDTYKIVKDKLKIFEDAKCEICVCACRTYGGTIDAIMELTNYENQFIDKELEWNVNIQSIVNRNDAIRLLSEINNLL